ncbi:hypothetical protein F66182_14913, partial [Fusarium sp. NRRL 66182]
MDAAWITDLGLTPVVLDYLLDKFRGMASYFPFVQLSETWTAALMAENRPFLLLAAVTAASSKHCHLQDALVSQFKESLSKRVVMAGEKDIDLLQGLLVHLAWFQFHFIPGSQQDYLYVQIAISIVIDLHLDQEAADLLGQRTNLGNIYTREGMPLPRRSVKLTGQKGFTAVVYTFMLNDSQRGWKTGGPLYQRIFTTQ